MLLFSGNTACCLITVIAEGFEMWFKRNRLKKLVSELAIYNDKGIAWKSHSPEKVEAELARLLALIKEEVERIGRNNIPSELIAAIQDGSLLTDFTGKYIAHAKRVQL